MPSLEEKDKEMRRRLAGLANTEYWEALKDFLFIEQGNAVADLVEIDPDERGKIASNQEKIKVIRWIISAVEAHKHEEEER